MKGYCKNCGHWLVASYYQEKPAPLLKRVCRKCGSVWMEDAKDLLRALQILPPAASESRSVIAT